MSNNDTAMSEELKRLKKAALSEGLISDGWHREGGLAVWSAVAGKWVSWSPKGLTISLNDGQKPLLTGKDNIV